MVVGFKNRYLVLEVFLDPNGDLKGDDPIIITQFNVSKAVKDSILLNFGECGLASSLRSFQGRLPMFCQLLWYFEYRVSCVFQFTFELVVVLCSEVRESNHKALHR